MSGKRFSRLTFLKTIAGACAGVFTLRALRGRDGAGSAQARRNGKEAAQPARVKRDERAVSRVA